jgi:hypothetical protein
MAHAYNLATQVAEIRIMVQSNPRQIVRETVSQKTLNKNRAGGVAQGEGPEVKPQSRDWTISLSLTYRGFTLQQLCIVPTLIDNDLSSTLGLSPFKASP